LRSLYFDPYQASGTPPPLMGFAGTPYGSVVPCFTLIEPWCLHLPSFLTGNLDTPPVILAPPLRSSLRAELSFTTRPSKRIRRPSRTFPPPTPHRDRLSLTLSVPRLAPYFFPKLSPDPFTPNSGSLFAVNPIPYTPPLLLFFPIFPPFRKISDLATELLLLPHSLWVRPVPPPPPRFALVPQGAKTQVVSRNP